MKLSENKKNSMGILMLGAIGVVFGDIGTSPLYALKECLKPFVVSGISQNAIFGICSLIIWAITLVVSVKYILFVMKADNHGEGGILSLMSLSNMVAPKQVKYGLLILGLFGAATFYGDGIITPAISVLSAVEGLELVSPTLSKFVLPIAFIILFLLFWIQKKGTESVGKIFAPVMVIWFITLGIMGISQIIQHPQILHALNPIYAFNFLTEKPRLGILVLGSVFLAVTGGEALYADMGHFGNKPITYGWFYLVFPSLALNYLGQGALILAHPKSVDNPFYNMAPSWALIPLVILSTLATVIASQAVISGAFSMTKQAIQLGYIPRFKIIHTSDDQIGQIYLPFINWILFISVALLLSIFRTSDSLANAYGIAVVTTMIITTLLMGFVIKYKWNWNPLKLWSFMVVFLTLDGFFLGSNMIKIAEGGWIPLTFATLIFFIMTTWKKGRALVAHNVRKNSLELTEFIPSLIKDPHLYYTKGTGVFLNSMTGKTPVSFMHNLKHNHVVHEKLIFLTIVVNDIPYVNNDDRLKVVELDIGAYQVIANLGFKESPDVPKILKILDKTGLITNWTYDELDTSFFLSRETVLSTPGSGMNIFRENCFSWLSRNATRAADHFCIPPNRVVELGSQVCI